MMVQMIQLTRGQEETLHSIATALEKIAEHTRLIAANTDKKSEADKVIAELEMKLAIAQQVLRLNKPEALYSNLETMSRLTHEKYVIERRERHHKYKRCLAMARWCHDKRIMSLCWDPADGYTADYFLHYKKWEKRWLALAEKFKEAK